MPRFFALLLVLLTLLLGTATRPAAALNISVIPITGQLLVGGSPVTGNYDFQFQLYNAATGGTAVGPLVTITNVAVADGVFYAEANFGNSLNLGSSYLYVQTSYRVHPASGSPAYTALTPRHVAPATLFSAYVPYASSSGNTIRLQNVAISATAPTNGQALVYNGTAWTPGLLGASSFSLPLQLSGSNTNLIFAATNTGSGYGLYGSSVSGSGVYGSSSSGYGIYGGSASGAGVYGFSNNQDSGFLGGTEPITGSHYPVGVFGSDVSGNGYGVFGSGNVGVYGTGLSGVEGLSDGGDGVFGESNTGNAIVGSTNSGLAGEFFGNVDISGNLSKSGGSFKIDHPLDPAHKYLYHSFVESPDMMNIYNGVVTLDSSGAATVPMPDWFEALNQDFRYQLTAMGAPGTNLYVASEVQNNQFRIAGGKPGMKVSWMVTGIRHDAWANAHRIPVEEDKPAKEQGLYLHPKEWGQPEERGVDYARRQAHKAVSH